MNQPHSLADGEMPHARLGRPQSRSRALLALALLLPAPTVGVIVAMMLPQTQGTPFGQMVYTVTKVWILALPFVWSFWEERNPIRLSKPWRAKGLSRGILLGGLIAAAILATYFIVRNRMI